MVNVNSIITGVVSRVIDDIQGVVTDYQTVIIGIVTVLVIIKGYTLITHLILSIKKEEQDREFWSEHENEYQSYSSRRKKSDMFSKRYKEAN